MTDAGGIAPSATTDLTNAGRFAEQHWGEVAELAKEWGP